MLHVLILGNVAALKSGGSFLPACLPSPTPSSFWELETLFGWRKRRLHRLQSRERGLAGVCRGPIKKKESLVKETRKHWSVSSQKVSPNNGFENFLQQTHLAELPKLFLPNQMGKGGALLKPNRGCVCVLVIARIASSLLWYCYCGMHGTGAKIEENSPLAGGDTRWSLEFRCSKLTLSALQVGNLKLVGPPLHHRFGVEMQKGPEKTSNAQYHDVMCFTATVR